MSKKPQLSLYKATQKAHELAQKTRLDHYVVARRIMGDYHIVVMNEEDFWPFTSLRLNDRFHEILRTKRVDWSQWRRDPNQCGMDKYWPTPQES